MPCRAWSGNCIMVFTTLKTLLPSYRSSLVITCVSTYSLNSSAHQLRHQVLVLVSSGAATKWQVARQEFVTALANATPGFACAALGLMSESHTVLRDAPAVLRAQLASMESFESSAEQNCNVSSVVLLRLTFFSDLLCRMQC